MARKIDDTLTPNPREVFLNILEAIKERDFDSVASWEHTSSLKNEFLVETLVIRIIPTERRREKLCEESRKYHELNLEKQRGVRKKYQARRFLCIK